MIKFIIIDDEPYVTALFPKMLNWQDYGFELAGTFVSGYEAMAWLEKNHCDVIFTDISMPDLSGTEIAKLCYETFPQILIVFFSAHRNFDYALNAIRYNVFEYILKPISQSLLKETVVRLKDQIEKSQKSNEFEKYESTEYEQNDAINSAKQFVNEHYNEEISIADVAKHVHLSPGYFSNYFKEKTNENFVSFLKNVRLEKAKVLLKNKTVKISHIPHQIGFNSYSYFTKVFQEAFGITPSAYREEFFKNLPKKY